MPRAWLRVAQSGATDVRGVQVKTEPDFRLEASDEAGSGVRSKIIRATSPVAQPSGLRLKAALPAAVVVLPELPSVAGLVIAAAVQPDLAQHLHEWAGEESCIIAGFRSMAELASRSESLQPDLVVIQPAASDPEALRRAVAAIRHSWLWVPILYVAKAASWGSAAVELTDALACDVNCAVHAGIATGALLRSAKNLLLTRIPPYERLIMTKRVVIRGSSVRVDGRVVLVGDKHMPLLRYLAKHAGRIVTADEIEREVADATLEPRSVGKRVQRLRYAVGDRERTLVRSIRNQGFLIER